MEQLDGEAISAFSRWAGWRVGRLRVDAEQRELSDLARGGAVELVVIVVDPGQPVAASEPLCTSLRRAADPPVILLADLAGGGRAPRVAARGWVPTMWSMIRWPCCGRPPRAPRFPVSAAGACVCCAAVTL